METQAKTHRRKQIGGLGRFVTVSEMAALLCRSSEWVRQQIKAGNIKGGRLGNHFYVAEEEVERLLPGREPTANPNFNRAKWFSNPANRNHFVAWRLPGKRVLWRYMRPSDYVAYWELIIRPVWVKTTGYAHARRPPKSWFDSQGFREFYHAINGHRENGSLQGGYLRSAGVLSIR